MTGNEFKYWVFLSFSPLDNSPHRPDAPAPHFLRWADRLGAALQSFSVPPEFSGQPNSRGEIVPERIEPVYHNTGLTLTAADRTALEQSRCLIVICSPRAIQSEAVNEAVLHFKRLGRGNRILPIVIAGEPNASDPAKSGGAPDRECFVPALLHPLLPTGQLDFARREAGYFFADARYGAERAEITTETELPGETEQAIAKIHLISGVLGVGFYGLWQREQKRRFVGFAAAQQQVREVQSQFEFARDQAQSAQTQLQALQAQARETLSQLEAARQEIRDAQTRLLAGQNVPLDVQGQIREAQEKALAAQNQSQAMHNQLEALQAQSRASQEQLESARQQMQAAEQKAGAAEQQSRITQAQVEQARQQARETREQLDAAQQQLRAAQEKSVAVPPPANSLQPEAPDWQAQLLAAQEQTRAAEARLAAATARAATAETNLTSAQIEIREARQQNQELQQQARGAQAQLDQVRQEVHAAQEQVRAIESQTRDVQAQIAAAQRQAAMAQEQTRAAQAELAATRDKAHAAGRRTRIIAVLAVLAALAAGVVLSQRNTRTAATNTTAAETFLAANATNQLDAVQIREALQLARGLDSFPARIPTNQIAGTLELAATLLTETPGGQLRNQLLDRWLHTDAAAAFDWSLQVTNAALRAAALARTIPGFAATGSSNALTVMEWLLNPTNAATLPPEQSPAAILPGLFQRWATNDLAAATAASAQLPAGETKGWVEQIMLRQRIQNDPAAVASTITNLPPGDHRQDIIAEISARWGQTDPTNALAWMESLPGAGDRRIAFDRIVGNWALKDLGAATNWLVTLPENQHDGALLTLAYAWARQDAHGLAALAFALPPGEVQTRCATAAVQSFATNDLARAMELLQPLTNNAALRARLVEQTAALTAAAQFQATADLIATLPAEDQPAAITGLASRWGAFAPAAALDWLRRFPETNAQPAQVESVLSTWAETEPAAVAQWLAGQPTNSVSDAMVTAFLTGAAVKYPEFGAEWTQTVSAAEARQKFQAHLARQWLKTDPAAAQKWIETLNLPARLQRTLK